MAKRKAQKRKKATSSARKRTTRAVSGERLARKAKRTARTALKGRRAAARKKAGSRARKRPAAMAARLNRARRTLEETVQSPPSSLDMKRGGSAVRTGRAEVAEDLEEHRGMSRAITGGDVDVDIEDAYFTGDEAPGGDNPTPDQDVVDDIGKALGLQYEDNEELKAVDKVTERDRKRWELDPASSEDYKDRR